MNRAKHPPRTAPGTLLAVDPAKRRCGVALFVGSTLVWAETLHTSGPTSTAFQIRRLLVDRGVSTGKVVAEIPKTYDDARVKDHNLTGLRELVDLLDRTLTLPVLGTYPSEWKGNVPKGVCEHRIRGLLSDAEIAAMLDKTDDTFDAVGLGLWYLRRAHRGMTT